MVLERFRRKKEEGEAGKESEFLELDSSAFERQREVNVHVETLEDFSDTNRIQDLVRDGAVVFLKIKKLRMQDISELKRSVEKLRKTCSAMSGDIVGVDEDFLVLTPNFAKVFRGKAE